jgi:hypothetical protein
MPMKKLLFALMIALFAFTGCVLNDDKKDDDNGGNTDTGTAAEYLPFKTDNLWNFDTTTVNSSGYNDSGTYTLTVTGTTTINSKTYWILSSSDEYDEAMYMRIDGNIVYQNQDMTFFGKNAVLKTALREAISAAQDLPMFNFGKSANQTWSVFSQSGTEQGGAYTVTMTGKHGGTESVTTPAGTYSNCVKFIITTEAHYTGPSYTVNWSSTMTMWFARNVGPVKILEHDEEEGYTSTTTDLLTSYQVN